MQGRVECGAVAHPAVERGAVERLADLGGACGCDRRFVLVEVQAGGLEGQAAEIKQAADGRLEVRDHALIMELAEAVRRQGSGEAADEAIEADIIAGRALEAVCIGIVAEAGCEQLAVVGEDGVGGMAAEADDARFRQSAEDVRRREDIERHLVDEAAGITKEEARKKLDALGVKLPLKGDRGFHDALAKLEAQTQQKVKDIFKQVKAGTLTKEEAQKKLDALGVKLPMKEDRGFRGALAKLDAQTQQKVKDIFKQVKAGTLTKEKAQKKLDALGVKLPGALTELDKKTQQH